MAAFEETTWNTEMETSFYGGSHRLSFVYDSSRAGFLNYIKCDIVMNAESTNPWLGQKAVHKGLNSIIACLFDILFYFITTFGGP